MSDLIQNSGEFLEKMKVSHSSTVLVTEVQRKNAKMNIHHFNLLLDFCENNLENMSKFKNERY